MITVVVLSLPRSGSSLLAGILQRLGIQMGHVTGLIRRSFVNKYGNYENQDFYGLNLNILYHAQSFSLSWADIPNDKKVKLAVKYYEPWIKLAIMKNERELWGWKDVTSIYTLPYFEHLLKNPHYIILKREIESVVKSHLNAAKFIDWYQTILYMSKYFNIVRLLGLGWGILKKFLSHGNVFFDEKRYRTVIQEGYSRIDTFVKDKKHLYVDFYDLTGKPQEVINNIINFLDILPSTSQTQKALAFIDPEQVHFQKRQAARHLKKQEVMIKSKM